MCGSQASCAISIHIRLVTTRTLVTPCHGYCITNNNKYSIAKSGRTNEYWGFNLHHGWNILTYNMLKILQEKLKMAEDSEDKQIMLTDAGSRIESVDIESSEVPYKVIPPEFKQRSCDEKMDVFGLVHDF